MKTKKKGFSLVELICTITIAAIIAAAAAPNVSAYIQNSKLQNYSTALNNLVGELQMQLPQKRYWNWQEVSETAEAILRNEVSRDITSSESGDTTTYTLTNVSTDENIEFELDVTYGVPSGIQQEITIDGRCTDYPSVISENNKCTVTLKNNYVDKGNYPTITQTINTSNSENGWKSMLNMAGTYGYWTDFFKDSANKKNDFGAEVVDTDGSAFYLNLTDYPAGSCEQVTFTMQRYQVTIDNEKTEFGYYDENGNWKYLGNSYSGYNEGDIYSVTKYYYIDDFGTEQPAPYNDPNGVYVNDKYYPTIVRTREYTIAKRTYDSFAFAPVYPRMQTQDASKDGGQDAIDASFSQLEIFVGYNPAGKEIWVKYSDVFDINHNYHIKHTYQALLYRLYYSDNIDMGESKGASYLWDSNSHKENIYIKYRVSKMPYSTRGWLYITGMVQGNKVAYINPVIDDTLQVYINYHKNEADYKPKVMAYITKSDEIDPVTNTNQPSWVRNIWVDISQCGYLVGNVLKITLTNVKSDELIKNFNTTCGLRCITPNNPADGGIKEYTDAGIKWLEDHRQADGTYSPSYGAWTLNHKTPFTFDEICTVKKITDSQVEIRVKATWALYPYLNFFVDQPCIEADFDFKIDFSMDWEIGDAEGIKETIIKHFPMVTINGDDSYTLLTFDWSQCDYITAANIGNMCVKFEKTASPGEVLSFDVYDKSYNKLTYNYSPSKMFSPTLLVDSEKSAVMSDKVVHLYFKGISANDIKYTIEEILTILQHRL